MGDAGVNLAWLNLLQVPVVGDPRAATIVGLPELRTPNSSRQKEKVTGAVVVGGDLKDSD